MTERYVALLPNAEPLGGRCPACGGLMDETSCRLGFDRFVRPEARRRTGIARITEVFCTGRPAFPVVGCPACAG